MRNESRSCPHHGEDHREIWLGPPCDACGDAEFGRLWAPDNPFDPCPECGAEPVRFIRADLTTRKEVMPHDQPAAARARAAEAEVARLAEKAVAERHSGTLAAAVCIGIAIRDFGAMTIAQEMINSFGLTAADLVEAGVEDFDAEPIRAALAEKESSDAAE